MFKASYSNRNNTKPQNKGQEEKKVCISYTAQSTGALPTTKCLLLGILGLQGGIARHASFISCSTAPPRTPLLCHQANLFSSYNWMCAPSLLGDI